MGLFNFFKSKEEKKVKLNRSVSKTSSKIYGGISSIFLGRKKIDEELLEELRRKTKEVEDIDYFKLKNILLPIEIEVINRYYGLNGKKSSSMYEIEKEIELEKGKGEEIFQVAINKLSMFGSELFQI